MQYDTLVIGAGAAGISCALILGSGLSKDFAAGKKVALIAHQKTSHLSSALINNALGIAPGTPGKEILSSGMEQLKDLYPGVDLITKQKVREISFLEDAYKVTSNTSSYTSKNVVIAVGYSRPFSIKGLEGFLVPHSKSKPGKDRLMLSNIDHLVRPGLFVAGTLAGHRSQFAIACGSGAAVATDILSLWNAGEHTKVHDKL